MTDGWGRYSFECIGNVNVMRSALECCHKGWGESTIIGVAGAGEEIHTRPFQLVTGRSGAGRRSAASRRSQLPGFVERYLSGEIKIDQMVSEVLPLEEINRAFRPASRGQGHPLVIRF